MTSVSIRAMYEEDLEGTYAVNIVGPDDLNIEKTRYLPGEKVTITASSRNYLLEVESIRGISQYSCKNMTDAENVNHFEYYFDMPSNDVTITLDWVICVGIEYGGTFQNITGPTYVDGSIRSIPNSVHDIMANPPDPSNYEIDFDHWEVTRGSCEFIEYRAPKTSIIVNESEGGYLTIKAVYKRSKYRVVSERYTDFGGSVQGHGHYAPGDIVTLTAVPNEGNKFRMWVQSVDHNDPSIRPVDFDRTANPTSFIMPEHDVDIAASFMPV